MVCHAQATNAAGTGADGLDGSPWFEAVSLWDGVMVNVSTPAIADLYLVKLSRLPGTMVEAGHSDPAWEVLERARKKPSQCLGSSSPATVWSDGGYADWCGCSRPTWWGPAATVVRECLVRGTLLGRAEDD